MALAEEDILFIKQHLGEWLAEQSLGKPPAVYEIELRERNDRHFLWLVGFIATSAGLIIAAMRFLPPPVA